MSFGFSASDAILLVQLAWNTVQNSLKAVGEHDELTREASCLHIVLRRLGKELERPESPLNRPDDTCREELESIVAGCSDVLSTLDRILDTHNSLNTQKRSVKKLMHCYRFGNRYVYIRNLRSKLCYYNSARVLFLNMVLNGAVGRVEQQLDSEFREMRLALNKITAQMIASAHDDGTVLTAYTDDDTAVWKEFRRDLIKDGFRSSVIDEHKNIILAYVKELGSRGVLDEMSWQESEHLQYGGISDESVKLQTHGQLSWPLTPHQDVETLYDGNLGLGSMLSVDSRSCGPSSATVKPVPLKVLQDITILNPIESSSDTRNRNRNLQITHGHGLNYCCHGYHVFPTKSSSSRPESRLVFRETSLPLTIRPLDERPRIQSESQALVRHSTPGGIESTALMTRHLPPQQPQYLARKDFQTVPTRGLPSGHHGALPRRNYPRTEARSKHVKKDEKNEKTKKYMRNIFFSGLFAAHVLISFI